MNPNTSHQSTGKHPFFWIILLLAIAALGFYVFAGLAIFRYGALAKDCGWDSVYEGDRWYISKIDPQGPAAGKLEPGDRILAINGDTRIKGGIRWNGPIWLKLRTIPPESFYTIRVARGPAEHQFKLKVLLRRDSRDLGFILSILAVSFVFYINSILIGTLKPEQRIVQIASISSLATALVQLGNALEPTADFFQRPELILFFLIFAVMPFHLALSYHFSYRFPPGVPRGRFWSLLNYLIYAWAFMLFVPFRLINLIILRNEQEAMTFFFDHYRSLTVIWKFYDGLVLFAIIAMCIVISRNYRLVKEPNQRRRIKWIVYGLVAGMLPWFIIGLARVILKTGFVLANGAFQAANLALMVIPVTSAYAIIKHRVFDINVVIRRGVQYLLAKNVLRIILSLPLIGLALTIISNPNRTVAEIFFRNSSYFYLLIAAALSLKFRRQLREWIDRKFFREAYDQEKILLGLIDEIKKLDSMSEISKLVSNELDSALHPKSIYVFYREEEKRNLTLGYSSGSLSQNDCIPEESQLLRIMEDHESAQEFSFSQRKDLPEDEKEWLEQLGINLIVPMSGSDHRLVGLLMIGEKRSEEPYTPNDRKLLQAIAGQMAVVYENVWLKGHVDRERKIKREVLARFEEQNINLVKECPSCSGCFDSSVQFCPKDNTELTLSLPVERTIEGKYRLDRLIGKGGMGAVYEAVDLRLNRNIAIKILVGRMFGDQAALRRFEREARASAKLSHPNIISIYDYGRISTEGAYLVMELIRGFTLRSAIRRAGNLDPVVAAEWFDQLLEGVKAAHQAGIIHRDLKPENVLISEQEKGRTLIKILDFGLAKIRQLDTSDPNSLTVPGTVMGTFGYMSPEQLSGEDVNERSDIFSLGVMVVEALTGRRPFNGRTYTELMASILNSSFHLKGDSKEVERLDGVLQKCLAKDREKRFASVAEMQKELIPAIRNCPPFAAHKPSSSSDTLIAPGSKADTLAFDK